MLKSGAAEKYVRPVQDICEDMCEDRDTGVRCAVGETDGFEG